MLTDKQERFCKEYVIDLNATRAAIAAGYSEKTANAAASRLLTNVKVENKIQELQKAIAKKLEVDAEWVLKRLINQVESNVLDAFATLSQESFTLEDLKALPREIQMCIKKVKQTSGGIEIQFEDKQKALEMIGRHIGFFEKDNTSKVEIEMYGNLTDEQLENRIEAIKNRTP